MDDNTNLVKFTTRSWSEICRKAWGSEFDQPDVVYQFSNGKKFLSTDKKDSGIYED